jgi:hypothetical protein
MFLEPASNYLNRVIQCLGGLPEIHDWEFGFYFHSCPTASILQSVSLQGYLDKRH